MNGDIYYDDAGPGVPGSGLLGSVERLASKYLDLRIAREVDSEFLRPWTVNDPAAYQYTLGPQGQLYRRGQPARPGAMLLANPALLIAGLVAGGLVLYFALKG